ncbi:hypothetical protein OV207_11535 [Corallococcus sp. BB11-1]|uniref:hypothetical protein n=1 Tax=Corallococcus sp. BB11-1 TaxID=2996783 RepID=UPI0010F2875F|nr:hypothetical protein [Corallococcus sp. BB11-1]MCY1032092.1 hypothetical protein [Corallococcus sp. BB11-1]RYZ41871.1 MAG: hypothetical protein EOO72_07680 [Myxococcaceae bacterium]
MKTFSFRMSALMLALAAQGATAFEYNVDLENTGTTTAYDIAVVLSGTENITRTFDGYTSGALAGRFDAPTFTPTASGDTVIHWMNMDGWDAPIPPGKVIHVGWSSADCSSQIKDMYWTNKSHGRLRNSVIKNLTHNIVYTTGRFPDVVLTNHQAHDAAVLVRDVRFAVVDGALPLEALSSMNVELLQMLRPVKEGSFTVAPGQEVRLSVPVEVQPGQSLIAVWSTGGDEAQGAVSTPNAVQGARALHFMQRPNNPGGHDGSGC